MTLDEKALQTNGLTDGQTTLSLESLSRLKNKIWSRGIANFGLFGNSYKISGSKIFGKGI